MSNESNDRVVSWNAQVHRDTGDVLDGLAEIMSNTNADAVALQEFKGYVGAARNRFGAQWYIYAHNDWAESNDNPVMVRKAIAGPHAKKRGEKDGWDTLRTKTDWTGPKGGVHHGRTWTWVKLSGLWILSLHRCTDGNGKNKQAFAEEHDKLVKWIGNHNPTLVIGDHNCGPGATYYGASKVIAQDAGGKINHDGGIDYAIVKGAKGDVVHKGSKGSDHAAILWKRTG